MLAKSKFSSIETLVSQALIDMEISHEEFITILKDLLQFCQLKSFVYFFVYIKMNTFALFTAEAWKKMVLKLLNMLVKYR